MLGFNYTVGFPETVTVLSSSLIVARSPRKDIASTLQKKPSSRSRRLRRFLQSNRRAIPPNRQQTHRHTDTQTDTQTDTDTHKHTQKHTHRHTQTHTHRHTHTHTHRHTDTHTHTHTDAH